MARTTLPTDIQVAAADPRVAIPRADMSGPQAIEALGEIGGNIISNVQQGRTSRAVSDVADSFSIALKSADQGIQYDELGNPTPETVSQASDELQTRLNQVQGDATARLRRISLATEQGKYHGSLATRIEMEKEVRQLMSQTPGFEREIRQTAASVLGFDPTGAAIRQLLDIQAPAPKALTEIDKFEQEVDLTVRQYISVGINVSRATVHQIMSQAALRGRTNAMIQAQVEQGNLSSDQAIDALLDGETVSPFAQALAKIGVDKANGVVRGWEDTTNMIRSVEAAEQASLQQMLKDAKKFGGVISPAAQRKIEEWNTSRYAPIKQLFEEESLVSTLTNKFEQVEMLTKAAGWEMAPEIMFMNTAFGPQITGTLIDIMANSMTTGGFSMLSQYFPVLTSLFGRDSLSKGSAVPTIGTIARRILDGDTSVVVGPNGRVLSDEDTAALEAEAANSLLNGAETKEDYTAVIEKLKSNRPRLALAQLSKDPNSFSQITPQERGNVKSFLITDRANILSSVVSTVDANDQLTLDPETGTIVSAKDAERPSLRKVVQGMTGAGGAFNMSGNRATPNAPNSGAVVSLNHHLELLKNPQWRQYLMPNTNSYEDAANQLEVELQLQHTRSQLADANYRSAGNALQRKGFTKEQWDSRIADLQDRERRLNATLAVRAGFRAQ